jgi:hypothetical protein
MVVWHRLRFWLHGLVWLMVYLLQNHPAGTVGRDGILA